MPDRARLACFGFSAQRRDWLERQLADQYTLSDFTSDNGGNRIARRHPTADVLLIGPDADNPLGLAESFARWNGNSAIVIVNRPESASELAGTLRLHPILGRLTHLMPLATLPSVPDLLRDLRQRTADRERHSRLLQSANRELAGAARPAVNRLAYLDQLLEHAPIGVVLLAEDDTTLAANRLANRYFQIERGGERRLADIFPGEQVAPLRELIEETRAGRNTEPRQVHLRMDTAIGTGRATERDFSVIAAPVGQFDDASSTLLIFQDISEVVRLQTAHEQARETAERANMSKSRLLAGVSHELRTPMNAISGFSEIMANELLGPMANQRYREYAKLVFDSARHLTALIDDLLDLSKIDSGILHINEEEVELCGMAEDCAHMVRSDAEARGQSLTVDVSEDDIRIRADRRMVRQVMLNLLTNAIKFTPEGGAVCLSLWHGGDGAGLAVADNGYGIAASEVEEVLKPFERGQSAASRFVEGSGIGLYLVQRIVTLHGARLEIDSTVDVGTRISITFPPQRVIGRPGNGPRGRDRLH